MQRLWLLVLVVPLIVFGLFMRATVDVPQTWEERVLAWEAYLHVDVAMDGESGSVEETVRLINAAVQVACNKDGLTLKKGEFVDDRPLLEGRGAFSLYREMAYPPEGYRANEDLWRELMDTLLKEHNVKVDCVGFSSAHPR